METLDIFQFGEFEIDPGSRSVSRGKESLVLSRRAFDVLLYLVRHPGKVVSKEELLRNVWPDSFVDENSLAQSISVLRKALGEKPGENGYILTLPGRGYQFICPVRSITSETTPLEPHIELPNRVLYEEHTVRTSVVTEEEELVKTSSGRARLRIALVAGILTGLGVAGFLVWKHTHLVPPSPLVVIADLENATGESGLSQVLDSAIAADFKQSPYLNFLSQVHVQETLTQMQQKKDALLTPTLAREVCLRNNAQVLLKGVVAKFGQKYLLTLDAIDCVSGDSLATSKSEAATADAIPHAIDTVATNMRKKLGESRSSIHRFDTPLFAENTGSLDALRNYSNARRLALRGKYADAIPLFQHAIELDPKFATAYADLSASYRNLGDRVQEISSLTKAYELRELANEPDRLFIIARYHQSVTGNLDEGLRNYRAWTEIYPRNSTAWGAMADLYIQLGQPELAIPPARRSLELSPDDAVGYVILGRALMHAGQLEEAKSVCELAVAKGLDGDDLHSLLLQVDIARNDLDGIKSQIAWARNHPTATRMRLNEALLAASQGRILQGKEILETISSAYKQQGLENLHTFYLLAGTRILAETGHPQEAHKLLDSLSPISGMTDPIVAMAETGEEARAENILTQELAQHPDDTMWKNLKGPQIRAAIFMARHKPDEAVETLQSARPYDLREMDTLYMRGTAYLEANQLTAAEQEFRRLIDHQCVDPLSYLYPLAHLGLARTLARENRTADSLTVYEKFFALWKDADRGEPLLNQAHTESDAIKVARNNVATTEGRF
ncbi:MAG: transcriptional regulator, CadC [Acidobacteriaceae bacterium]|nr:transcriptional regulator, CadC [Acidobacteriaceae bacterium]